MSTGFRGNKDSPDRFPHIEVRITADLTLSQINGNHLQAKNWLYDLPHNPFDLRNPHFLSSPIHKNIRLFWYNRLPLPCLFPAFHLLQANDKTTIPIFYKSQPMKFRMNFKRLNFSAAKLPQSLIIPLPAARRDLHTLRQIFAGMNRRVLVQVTDQLAAAVGNEKNALPISGVKLFFNHG